MNAIYVGTYTDGQYLRRVEVEPRLETQGDGKLRLAIQSTAGRAYKVGDRRGTFRYDAYGDPFDYSGGQAIGEVEAVTHFAPGWNAARRDRLVDIWRRWHLNDMNAACEHQRALGWTYDSHRGQSCPTCGYQIGTAWLYEELPADVVAFMREVIDGK